MPSRPVLRHVQKQIKSQGGWPRILERIASGETVADIARTIQRPDGQPISRNFLSMLLHADEERSKAVTQARIEGASAMVDDALHAVDSADEDRDSINKAKVRGEMRLKVAGFIDRQGWGENKQPTVSINVASLHLDALRHRAVELTGHQDPKLVGPGDDIGSAVAAQTSADAVVPARETA